MNEAKHWQEIISALDSELRAGRTSNLTPPALLTQLCVLYGGHQLSFAECVNIAIEYALRDQGKTLTKATEAKPTRSILEEAQDIIYGDREKTYGHPSKNLSLIAEYWSGHLSNAGKGKGISLTADDVCVMMALLKLARLANDPTHRDSKVDTAGYIALMQRCQEHNSA